MMHRIAFGLLASSAWILAVPNRVAAQIYPEHPIKIIVSSAAGGPLDIVGRAVADKLAASLKQPVVVETRTGAGGNIAADFVSRSPSDGYTLLFVLSSTLTVNPHLYKRSGFQSEAHHRRQLQYPDAVRPPFPAGEQLGRVRGLGEEGGPGNVCSWRGRHVVAFGDGVFPDARRIRDGAGAVPRCGGDGRGLSRRPAQGGIRFDIPTASAKRGRATPGARGLDCATFAACP